MKRNYTYIILILSISSIFFSCASPSPVTLLKSNEKNSTWIYGKEVIEKTSNSITMAISYDRNYGNELHFDIEFINESDKPVLVAPETFYYKIIDDQDSIVKIDAAKGKLIDSYNGNYDENYEYNKEFAINPEIKILEIDKQASMVKADEENHRMKSSLIGLAMLAGDIASITCKDPEKKENWYQMKNNVNSDLERNSAEIQNRIINLNNDRDYWSMDVLRKTTLPYNYSVRGRVIFIRNLNARRYLFYFPVGTVVYEIEYLQENYEP